MELEIKHLSPYLPYGLKIQHNGYTEVLEGLSGELCSIAGESYWNNIADVKPILRLMSDLTSVYGDEYINEHSINMLIGRNNGYGDITISQFAKTLCLEIEVDDSSSVKQIEFDMILTISNQLFKGHYDVFGLIEQGLAIDINTIKPSNHV